MDFLVNRADLHECRVDELEIGELEPGHALLQVDTFGLTTNNITYAVFGDGMSYWDFFPAPDGWGRGREACPGRATSQRTRKAETRSRTWKRRTRPTREDCEIAAAPPLSSDTETANRRATAGRGAGSGTCLRKPPQTVSWLQRSG